MGRLPGGRNTGRNIREEAVANGLFSLSSLPQRRIHRKSLYLRKLEKICLEHISVMDNIRRRQLS